MPLEFSALYRELMVCLSPRAQQTATKGVWGRNCSDHGSVPASLPPSCLCLGWALRCFLSFQGYLCTKQFILEQPFAPRLCCKCSIIFLGDCHFNLHCQLQTEFILVFLNLFFDHLIKSTCLHTWECSFLVPVILPLTCGTLVYIMHI